METSETRRETGREASVESSGREHTSRETTKGTSGDKCKNIQPCVSRVRRDKWETSATRTETSRETSGDRCKNIRPTVSRVGKGNISRGTLMRLRGPERTGRQVGDKCKIMRPKAPKVRWDRRETSGKQV